ncbi:hypothetical protein GWN43_02060, partial [Candidatus Bathyarchaeota archaeon]|nr:hypothetical protein [Candidatus Bathyarchaeota archaeon]
MNNDGYDDFLIGAYGDEEGGISAGQTYLILGRAKGWSRNQDLSEANASFLGEGTGDEAGKEVAGAGDVNDDGYDDILIGAPREDTGGGSDCGKAYLIFFDDGEPPVLRGDSTPTFATTGDPFTFNVTVGDNRGIANVTIEFWYGNHGYHWNLSARISSGTQTDGTWLLNITVPTDSIEPIHYIVHIADRAFNSILTTEKDVIVIDNDSPSISGDITPTNGTTGDRFQFKTNVTDNINLTEVRVEYWYGENGTITNTSMKNISDVEWDLYIFIPSDSLDELHYRFFAVDNSSNEIITELKDVTILDNDSPTIGEDITPPTIETDTNLSISISVIDNIGLDKVWIVYRYGDGPGENRSMNRSSGSSWEFLLKVPATVADIHYHIGASDTSGNVNLTAEKSVTVLD